MMTLNLRDFIRRLQEIERLHGGDDRVVVTGLYSSEAAVEDAESVQRIATDKDSYVVVKTDLCTG